MSLKKQIIEILKTSPEFIDILNEFPMPPPDVIGKNIKPDGPVMDDNFEEPGNYGDLGMPIEIMELLQLYQSQYVQVAILYWLVKYGTQLKIGRGLKAPQYKHFKKHLNKKNNMVRYKISIGGYYEKNH